MVGPVRTCIGCRRPFPAADLVRVRRSASGALVAGPGAGRGAWLCRYDRGCAERARSGGQFPRALRARIADAEVARFVEALGDAGTPS